MMLKHSREPVDGQPIENTFLAVDERTGSQLGACTIYCDENPALYPARPLQVRLQLTRTLGIDITRQVLRKIDIVDHRGPKPYNPAR